jgi:CheY-like chemotaxis protein
MPAYDAQLIVVVDDDVSILAIIRSLLSDVGFHVITAKSGQEAIACLEQATPLLLILDYMMPEMNGPQCLHYLREHDLLHERPVILLTADGQAAEKAQDMRVNDLIKKPFAIDDLLATVDKYASLT